MSKVQDYREYRTKMNKKVLDTENLVLKRIFNLDKNAFGEGALPSNTKELLGLVASMVLRCDDCVKYHLDQCFKMGYKKEEVMEVCAIANLIGGTIVIPQMRKAIEFWDLLEEEAQMEKVENEA